MLIYNPGERLQSSGFIAGVADYDWDKWEGAPITDADKAKAAGIADGFKSQADADKYMAESSDPLKIKFLVQYAVTAKKKPAFQTTFTSSAQLDASAVNVLLPKGGMTVLNAPETLPQQKSKAANDILASLMTDSVKKAIPLNALNTYIGELAPIIALDKGKAAKSLESFLARLRIWPILNRIGFLAQNELDPQQLDGTSLLLVEVDALVKKAKAMLPPDDAKTGDQFQAALDKLPSKVKAIKDAEVALMRAQLGKQATFTLAESHIKGPNAKRITWKGAVPVQNRVAVASLDTGTGKDTWEYPIPDVYLMDGQYFPFSPTSNSIKKVEPSDWRNVTYVAEIPGLADYIPLNSYDQSHGKTSFNGPGPDSNGKTATKLEDLGNYTSENDNVVFESGSIYGSPLAPKRSKTANTFPAADGDYGIIEQNKDMEPAALERLNDQSMRLHGKPYNGIATTGGPNGTQRYTLGSMIAYGLWLDPEWGGGNPFDTKWASVVAASVAPSLRKAQSTYRKAIQGPDGEWTKAKDAKALVMGLLDNIAPVPVVPVKWQALGIKAKVLQPFYDWQGWTSVMMGDSPWRKNLLALLTQQNMQAWNRKYNDQQLLDLYKEIIDALKEASEAMDSKKSTYSKLFAWTPGKGAPLPYPLVYPMADALASVAKVVAADATSSVSGLSPQQITLVELRARAKASTLIAMKTSDIAASSQSTTDDMIKTLKELGNTLYGCMIGPAPEGTPDLLAYYKDAVLACANNPAPDSMAGQLAALVAQYAELKAKADAGDVEAQEKLALLAEKINSRKEAMGVMVATRVSRRKRATDNTTGKGGTNDMLIRSEKAINDSRLDSILTITVTGKDGKGESIEIVIPPTSEEKAASDGASSANDATDASMQNGAAYVYGAGEGLKSLTENWKLPVDPLILDDINSNANESKKVVTPTEKKGGGLLLLLLLGAAAAASRK